MWLAVSFAIAGPDIYGFGEGTLDIDVIDPEPLSRFLAIESDALAGDSSVVVDTTIGFGVGDLVFLHQSRGSESDFAGVIDPTIVAEDVGHWEFARITDIGGNVVLLDAPLEHDYPGGLSQVVGVVEARSVEILQGHWSTDSYDGSKGGILVIVLQESLTLHGGIWMSNRGFKGGFPSTVPLGTTCAGSVGESGAGLFNAQAFETDSDGQGGGGASCGWSGGGGGAGLGAGGDGFGGMAGQPGIRGQGGLQVQHVPDRLIFGGGGGGPHSVSSDGMRGRSGGGIVFVRARQIVSGGGDDAYIWANGYNVQPGTASGGAGGGGGGGSIRLEVGVSMSVEVSAHGGLSRDGVGDGAARGGGGGGGLIHLRGPQNNVFTNVEGLGGGEDGVLVEVPEGYLADADQDGFGIEEDCDDTDPSIHPDAPERCNGIDDRCSGEIPEAERDLDGDGALACDGDCDDTNAAVGPGQNDIPYDGIDQDCVGGDFDDVDGDGFPVPEDCNDADPEVNPAASDPDLRCGALPLVEDDPGAVGVGCGCRSGGLQGTLLGGLVGGLLLRRQRSAASSES